ncbi:MAG: hypothetical protein ACREQB_07380, partial [Candidatus Binataceae bacterium]
CWAAQASVGFASAAASCAVTISDQYARWKMQLRPPSTLHPIGSTDPHWSKARLRIAIICDQSAASQEVHLYRPLRRLRLKGDCALAIITESDVKKSVGAGRAAARAITANTPHVVMLSRYGGPGTAEIIDAARTQGARVIAHIDDFLLDVPADLGPAKVRQHMRPERIAAITHALNSSDLIYVSTNRLADKLRAEGFNRAILVAGLQSCADPDELARPERTGAADGSLIIGYQGTASHRLDLAMIAEALMQVMNARPNTRLRFFGTIEPPPALAPLGDRMSVRAPAGGYDAFLDALKEERWDIGLAPLRDTEFNRFRTYAKWTEYTIAATAVLASDCEAYRPVMSDGAGDLVSPDNWRTALLRALDNAVHRCAMVARAQDRLRRDLTLEQQESQVLAMLQAA